MNLPKIVLGAWRNIYNKNVGKRNEIMGE